MDSTWWVKPEDMNEEQRKIVELPPEKSHLIVGPPGSGKTNLLLLRANYLYLAGQRNILVIVFTGKLRNFVAEGSGQYDFPIDKIVTSTKWQQDLLSEHEVQLPEIADFEERRRAYVDKLMDLADKGQIGTVHDAVFLDEAQDYLPREIELFSRLGGSVYATADERQKIYDGANPIKTLESVVDETHPLRFHYRNGKNICRVADSIARSWTGHKTMTETSNYDEMSQPSTVEHLRCRDLDEQADKIIAKLETQLKAYPDEVLAVMCPRWEEVDKIWVRIASSPIARYSALAKYPFSDMFDPAIRVSVSTVHAAKGLEARAVHIAGAEFFSKFRGRQKKMAYTAVTRAKTSLTIYHCGNLPGYLESALSVLEPAPKMPDIRDAFRGKK